MSKPTPRLGKGLSALVTASRSPSHPAPPTADQPGSAPPAGAREIATDHIRPNTRQPRTEFNDDSLAQLAESIRTHGFVQPVVVREIGRDRFELVAGERRWRAAQRAGLATLPAIVRQCTDVQALELALIENLQREDLNPLERARAYRAYLADVNASVEALAERLSQSRANVANYVRLLSLGEEIQQMVNTGDLGMGQARAIAGISDPQRQLAIARLAVRRNLSVRQVETLIKSTAEPASKTPSPADGASRHVGELELELSRALGTKVKLTPGRKKNSGRIVIHYSGLDEFDRIAKKLGAEPQLE
ncbi:MAG: ParB/RepB/Spo0J family partition protein [Phycisphaerae bacterium]|nr:ParB/RepB/Spo0J family partition protein [Phycisphaerae bacterium]